MVAEHLNDYGPQGWVFVYQDEDGVHGMASGPFRDGPRPTDDLIAFTKGVARALREVRDYDDKRFLEQIGVTDGR